MLTTVYPRPDSSKASTATKVIHYFTSEWKKAGHDVVVVHTINALPKFVYYLPGKIKKIIKAKLSFEVPDPKIRKNIEYDYEGIHVFRENIRKVIPRGLSSDKEISKCAKSIVASLNGIGFEPDLIVGHWASPNAQLLAELKRYYACRNALVFHSAFYAQRFTEKMKEYIKHIDKIGGRSEKLAEELRDILQLKQKPFVCYSGVPDEYIRQSDSNEDKVAGDITRFLNVGEIIRRKNVDIIIRTLAGFKDRPWSLDIVGVGNELYTLQKLAVKLDVADRVRFYGRISRDEVFKIMHQAQVFTMVSRGEAFGLVYLEAMANSCLTIGSMGEGIDGVIEDEVNGFLCEAGSVDALKCVYQRIFDMPPGERRRIARSGYETACRMTDSNVAFNYLNDIMEGGMLIEMLPPKDGKAI